MHGGDSCHAHGATAAPGWRCVPFVRLVAAVIADSVPFSLVLPTVHTNIYDDRFSVVSAGLTGES
eukprot:991717-Prymnesium_polylepis.1